MSRIVFTLFLISFSFVWSQNIPIEWQNTIGAISGDVPYSIIPTDDGGCIVSGGSVSPAGFDKSEDSFGDFDYWVVKLDASGSIEWDNTIGGNATDNPRSLRTTPDGGYIIVGRSISGVGFDKSEVSIFFDYWVVKLDAKGVIEWDNTIQAEASEDTPTVVELTLDGGYIVGGFSDSNAGFDKTEDTNGGNDMWILKLNSSGDILWQNTIGGSESDRIDAIAALADGSFLLAGSSSSGISGDKTVPAIGGGDIWLVKIDENGVVISDHVIGGPDYDQPNSIYQTVDGGFIIGANSYSDAGGDKSEDAIGVNDYWIIKVDAALNIEWENTIGGSATEYIGHAAPTVDGGYLIAGSSQSDVSGDKTEPLMGAADIWMVKLDANGNVVYDESIGGESVDSCFRMEFGLTNSGFFMAANSLSGVSGDKTEPQIGNSDYWVMKLNGFLGVDEFAIQHKIIAYPNPVQDKVYFSAQNGPLPQKVIVYDLLGNKVKEEPLADSSMTMAGLNTGIYFLECIASNGATQRIKIIKE